jgi:hypothetical protein
LARALLNRGFMRDAGRMSLVLRLRRALLVLIVSSLGAACEPPATQHAFSDEGKVCVMPQGTNINAFLFSTTIVTLEANQPALVTVMMPTCLSSSCSHQPKAECTVTLSGDTLEVTSKGSYVEQGNVCTTDCGALVAKCTTPSLPAGNYQLRHGKEMLSFALPRQGTPPCAGQAP